MAREKVYPDRAAQQRAYRERRAKELEELRVLAQGEHTPETLARLEEISPRWQELNDRMEISEQTTRTLQQKFEELAAKPGVATLAAVQHPPDEFAAWKTEHVEANNAVVRAVTKVQKRVEGMEAALDGLADRIDKLQRDFERATGGGE